MQVMRLHGVTQAGRTKQVNTSAPCHCPHACCQDLTVHLYSILRSELAVMQDALQSLCGLQLMHPSALESCKVSLCIQGTLMILLSLLLQLLLCMSRVPPNHCIEMSQRTVS